MTDAEVKAHLEQNMLDGDPVQRGQMLSSQAVLDYLLERIQTARVAELELLLPPNEIHVSLRDYANHRIAQLKAGEE